MPTGSASSPISSSRSGRGKDGDSLLKKRTIANSICNLSLCVYKSRPRTSELFGRNWNHRKIWCQFLFERFCLLFSIFVSNLIIVHVYLRSKWSIARARYKKEEKKDSPIKKKKFAVITDFDLIENWAASTTTAAQEDWPNLTGRVDDPKPSLLWKQSTLA